LNNITKAFETDDECSNHLNDRLKLHVNTLLTSVKQKQVFTGRP